MESLAHCSAGWMHETLRRVKATINPAANGIYPTVLMFRNRPGVPGDAGR